MGKEPGFMFYPKDWRADSIFTCSLAARGLWLEMMNMMHASERYGYLAIDGLPISDESIAQYCGCTLQTYQALIGELERHRILSRTSNGIIFSRRMVADQKQRAEWRNQKQNQRSKANKPDVHPVVRDLSGPIPSPLPNKEKPKTFIPPTQAEVLEFMRIRKIPNPEKQAELFISHHANRKWRLSGGRGPVMLDWKKAVITWQGNMPQFGGMHGARSASGIAGNDPTASGVTRAEKRIIESERQAERVFGRTSGLVGSLRPDLSRRSDRAISDSVSGDAKSIETRSSAPSSTHGLARVPALPADTRKDLRTGGNADGEEPSGQSA